MLTPPLSDEERSHLQALSIAHYVYAVLLSLFALLGIVFILLGLFLPIPQEPGGPPSWIFSIYFGMMGSIFLLLYGAHAVATVMAGRFVQQRRRWKFCMVLACLTCTWFPIGTVLGSLTIFVLARPAVQAAFQSPPPVPATPPPLPAST